MEVYYRVEDRNDFPVFLPVKLQGPSGIVYDYGKVSFASALKFLIDKTNL